MQNNSTETKLSVDEKVEFLSNKDAYPHPVEYLEVKETHMSWVFITDELVYKLKKPVKYDFLDFSTLEKRHDDCKEEVRLNRRLADSVYLGIVPLILDAEGHLNLDSDKEGKTVDWLVKMNRLPSERTLENLIKQGKLNEHQLKQAAELLSAFYTDADRVGTEPVQYFLRLEKNIRNDGKELMLEKYDLPAGRIDEIVSNLVQFQSRQAELLYTRVQEGRVIEAHGDLRPEHIFLVEPEPVFIDCLEFNSDFRKLDIAEELSFLALECEALGAPQVGKLFFNVYTGKSGDIIPEKLMNFYKARRALLRAKLAISHISERHYSNNKEKWRWQAMQYIDMAEQYTQNILGTKL